MSYYVDYYYSQVQNGGFSQFIYNSYNYPELPSYIQNGLLRIGAKGHLDLFNRSLEALSSLDKVQLNDFLSGDYFGENPVREILDIYTNDFYTLDKSENIRALNSHWLRNHPELVILSLDAMKTYIKKYANSLKE